MATADNISINGVDFTTDNTNLTAKLIDNNTLATVLALDELTTMIKRLGQRLGMGF